MKKKKVSLKNKLFLQKGTIAELSKDQNAVFGGQDRTITGICCMTETCPVRSLPCNCIDM